jgi:DNA polymerase-4
MDAFYPSVEILDNPKLRGLPVIVGGSPQSRGVVASASYEARKFGVRSAMACALAYKLCPQAIFIRGRLNRYKEISQQIHAIFAQYTNLIEPISLDEAWLDVTENFQHIPSATWIAMKIKEQIKSEIRLTCSAGISYNKFLAKIASDEQKPDGIFVITPDSAQEFLQRMEVRKIPGVGKVTQQKLKGLGVEYGYQLSAKTEQFLVQHFGKVGSYLYNIIRGHDPRPVMPHRERKSISTENTFSEDYLYGDILVAELRKLTQDLIQRMQKKSFVTGKTMTLKVKFHDFQLITRSVTQAGDYRTEEEIFHCAQERLYKVCTEEFPNKAIRLLGVGISNFSKDEAPEELPLQLDFFELLGMSKR